MNKSWWAGFLAVVVLALGGCGQQAIDSNITVFHELPPSVAGKTVAVVAFPPELNDSLEFKAYRPLVEKYLMESGFEIASRDNADYVALFNFGFDRRAPAQIASLEMFKDVGDAVGYRPVSFDAVAGLDPAGHARPPSSFSTKRFETVAHANRAPNSGVYARSVAIDLVASSSQASGRGGKIYAARAVTVGSCVGKPEVVHKMVAAIFEGFPGRSGSTRMVRLPTDGNCRGGGR